ncbi:hypothetical protein AVEN_185800-1 [Araneus ventricosus]|uniref:Uncharacterized protein n=1 Tax=Araneus ventricosus TaxID=182803 RepID=A0A4Y2ECF5_ARAVE|nr:hypothetical protein AVEN_185800-1 [Araneus ventricosus]
MESIILSRLEAETENKLIPFHFGFRKGLSTTEQLIRMTEPIREGFNNYADTAAVFIDIAKAFSRVWILRDKWIKCRIFLTVSVGLLRDKHDV